MYNVVVSVNPIYQKYPTTTTAVVTLSRSMFEFTTVCITQTVVGNPDSLSARLFHLNVDKTNKKKNLKYKLNFVERERGELISFASSPLCVTYSYRFLCVSQDGRNILVFYCIIFYVIHQGSIIVIDV